MISINKQRYDKNRSNYEDMYIHLAAVAPLILDLLNTWNMWIYPSKIL